MNSMVRPRRRLQLLQQVEDLRLDGDVERGGRLVENQAVGLGRQRAGDQRALAHAAGQLVRIGVGHRAASAMPTSRSSSTARASAALARQAAVVDEPLADLLADAQSTG